MRWYTSAPNPGPPPLPRQPLSADSQKVTLRNPRLLYPDSPTLPPPVHAPVERRPGREETLPTAQPSNLTTFLDHHWDWRLSAHFRVGSLASAWLLMGLSPILGWLMFPLAAIRGAASLAQSGLNVRLGRHVPVGRPDRWDWALIAGIFALAYTAAGVSYVTGIPHYSPMLVAPMLLPFSALQLRMVRRSFRAQATLEAASLAVTRLEDYRRGDPREAADLRPLPLPQLDRAA